MTLERLRRKCRLIRTRTGQPVNVLDVGRKRAPVVLLVHGFGGSWQGWESQIEFFHRNGYRVIAPDLNGHGGTSFRPHPTTLNYAEDLFDVLERLGVHTPIHVVAHSYGGPVALTMAQSKLDPKFRPFASMSLINSFAKHPLALKWAASLGAWLYRVGEGRFSRKELTDRAQVVETLEDLENRALGRPRFYNVPPASENQGAARRIIDYVTRRHVYENSELQAEDERLLPQAHPDGLIGLFNAARNFYLERVLDLPALVIHSRRDRIIPYLFNRLQLGWSFNPRARRVRLATMSHVPQREYPDQVNAALLDHIRSVSQRH